MRLIATLPAKNEAHFIGFTARAMLMWCDGIAALNHNSTDATGAILAEVAAEHPGKVRIVEEPDPQWDEMHHRQRLLTAAREMGATHIAIVDADEALSGNLLPDIRGAIARMPRCRILELPWVCLWRGLEQWCSDPSSLWSKSWVGVAFDDDPNLRWRPKPDGYHFHQRQPTGRNLGSSKPVRGPQAGGLMHLQFVNWRRLKAKQALYKMQEVIRWPGHRSVKDTDQLYNHAVDERPLKTLQTPDEWFRPYEHLFQYLDLDESAAPWQEAECARLWEQHGPQKFAGLNLFGVVGQAVAAA